MKRKRFLVRHDLLTDIRPVKVASASPLKLPKHSAMARFQPRRRRRNAVRAGCFHHELSSAVVISDHHLSEATHICPPCSLNG
jgi:hypothetical protein